MSAARSAAAREAFALLFGSAPLAVCAAPGRVNLIGEHLDYAGGSVLPFAIQYGLAVAAGQTGRRGAGKEALRLASATGSLVQPDTGQLAAAERMAYEVLSRLYAHGRMRWPATAVPQWQLCVWSDLPLGSGLSSSAAFCVAVAGAVCAALDLRGISALELCQLCRAAEEAATDVHCGLMDQYAIVFGRAGQAVHFDARRLTHEYLPLELPNAVLAVIDSGQSRTLAASGYNQRRAELEAGHPARLRHVASEQQRVLAACAALRAGETIGLGELLHASQASLRDDYAVSSVQLDLLCSLLEADLAYGARLTGAGFGGNVLALLRPAALEAGPDGKRPLDRVLAEYAAQTQLRPVLRLLQASAGATADAGGVQVLLAAAPEGAG